MPTETSTDSPGRDGTSSDVAAELTAEVRYLAHARRCLADMREQVRSLDARGGDPVSTEFLKAELYRRAESLRDDPDVPLFFGRIDRESTAEQFHIGRRHVRDGERSVVVVDWRAEVSLAFYRASATEPMDVALRRRFGHAGGSLTSLEDEHLSAGEGIDLAASGIVAAEVERPRVGPMRDIVATIAPDQDVMVRAPLAQTLCIQGAPGTGKTAVGLHRAAFLLYSYREQLRRSRVLVVGPNRSFLGYIGALLPALGEVDVTQVATDDLVGSVAVRTTDPPELARLKGDARLATVIGRTVSARVTVPEESLVVSLGARRWRLSPSELIDLFDHERRAGHPYGTIRTRLPALIGEALRRMVERAGGSPDDRWVGRVARSASVRGFVDSHWPAISPKGLVTRLLSDPEYLAEHADGVLDAGEQRLLCPLLTGGTRPRWSRADAFLVDEAAAHVARPVSYGHVVVDEAQDLSPLACRAIGRRCETGSATVLGDLAQATAPDAAGSWSETLAQMGKPDAEVVTMTRGYRVPGEVLELANRLLPELVADLEPATSIRHAPGSLRLHPASSLAAAVVASVRDRLAEPGSIGVIAPDRELAQIGRALSRTGILAGSVRDGMDSRVELVPVDLCKGLEFDHVVVAEPAAIVAAHARGLHWLYVALTRAVSSLDVVHVEPLPTSLTAGRGMPVRWPM